MIIAKKRKVKFLVNPNQFMKNSKNQCKIYCIPENCGMIFNTDGELLMTVGTGTEIL